ncbi:hypothetical protein Drorol1_Dr00001590 [Drosera rotundifolia]
MTCFFMRVVYTVTGEYLLDFSRLHFTFAVLVAIVKLCFLLLPKHQLCHLLIAQCNIRLYGFSQEKRGGEHIESEIQETRELGVSPIQHEMIGIFGSDPT